MTLRQLGTVLILSLGYLLLPYVWPVGWTVMSSPPTVQMGQSQEAVWYLYIFGIHPYTRVVNAVAEFPDGSTWLLQAEPEDVLPRPWSLPTYRKVALVLRPEAWMGRPEGPVKIRVRVHLMWPRAVGLLWDMDWQRHYTERVVNKTLYVEKY